MLRILYIGFQPELQRTLFFYCDFSWSDYRFVSCYNDYGYVEVFVRLGSIYCYSAVISCNFENMLVAQIRLVFWKIYYCTWRAPERIEILNNYELQFFVYKQRLTAFPHCTFCVAYHCTLKNSWPRHFTPFKFICVVCDEYRIQVRSQVEHFL